MRRAGGWTLALVAVIGMAAAAFLAFRPILSRNPVAVEFIQVDGWRPFEETAVRLAFTEKGYRAGGRAIQPEFTDLRNRSSSTPSVLTILKIEDQWVVSAPPSSPTGPSQLELTPQVSQMGGPTARWAKRQGIRRVFIPGLEGSDSFAADFMRQAASDGIDCSTDVGQPQGRSLLDAFRASKADLVLLKLDEDAIAMYRILDEAGFTGRYLLYNPRDVDLKPRRRAQPLASAFIVLPIIPDLPSLTGRVPSANLGPNAGDYFGYLLTTLLLETIDRYPSSDPWEIYRHLAQMPEFRSADGRSALPGGLYLLKGESIEFVEVLK